jgi:hypothetical protein
MASRSTVNQVTQLGLESTHGTTVAANKRLAGAMFSFGIEADIAYYRGSGQKYDEVQELNREWGSGSLDESPMDYNWLVYPLAGVYGAPVIAASGASATAKDWTFEAPMSGNANPKTFTFEYGDSTIAEKYGYGLFTQWGYKGARNGAFTTSGTILTQRVVKGVTLTSSPTVIPLAPMNASQFDVFIDDDSATIGTSKIAKPTNIEFNFDSLYNPAWFLNTDFTSFAEHSDAVPNAVFKFTMAADTVDASFIDLMREGSTRYIQVKAVGAEIDATNNINNTFIHNLAVKVGKPDKYADIDGLLTRSWECKVVADSTWGHAHQVLLTNLITAL